MGIPEMYKQPIFEKIAVMKVWMTFLLALAGFTIQAQTYKLEGNEVKIDMPISFKTGTAELRPESDAALQVIKKYLDDKSYISLLRVEAHTDAQPFEAAGQALTAQRALAVCRRLVELGVDCKRLIPVGFGSTKPVAVNDTEEGRKANRRISFFNVALRGHAIGGLPADGGGKVAGDPCE